MRSSLIISKFLTLLMLLSNFFSLNAYGGTLDGYLFDTRPVLLFTTSTDSTKYKEQLAALSEYECEFYTRDLEVLKVFNERESIIDGTALTTEEVSFLKDELEVGPYNDLLVLVGKDGRVKLRAQMPFKPSDLIRLVDSMPMRQVEKMTRPQLTCHSA